MELLLWRWSTTAQITSALMIAVFFYVLGRSVRRVELKPWVNAWVVNLVALAVALIFWLAQPQSPVALILLRTAYLLAKTMFVLLFAFRLANWGRVTAAVAVLAFGAAFLLDTIEKIGVVQSLIIAVCLTAGAVRLRATGWLAAGFVLRAVLAYIETGAYALQLAQHPLAKEPLVGRFLASHSAFDTGAEWVIALGCVLALYRTIQQELVDANQALLAAKEVLQDLVDRDSLTGLANRRALPSILRDSYESGATILFFDLNDFKDINDSYGHHAGDDCLKRFARVIQTSFRPDDHVIRYAGDEFVVVAPAVEPDAVVDRIGTLRERLKFEQTSGPAIRFSVGHSYLPPRGDAEAALREADQAMYKDKKAKTLKMRTPRF